MVCQSPFVQSRGENDLQEPFSHNDRIHLNIYLTRVIRYLSILTLLLAVTGCSVFSGGREFPISEKAKKELRERGGFLYPVRRLNPSTDNAITFFVAFDGTLNDHDNVPEGEDKTVVSKLYDYVDAPAVDAVAAVRASVAKRYYKGPGCLVGIFCWFDAATGYSSASTARAALNELRKFAADRPPDVELNVVAVGFSRGAATARHFLNLVQRESKDGFMSQAQVVAHSFAILFDTVATGDTGTLELALPSNLEFAIHFVAQHEARPLFAPVIDDDSAYERIANPRQESFLHRILTLYVPGAHSDLGDSYLRGIGPLVTAHAKSILGRMGLGAPLLADLCPRLEETQERNVKCRTIDEGVHDSRGLLDQMLGVGSPYACGFQRRVAKRERAPITVDQAKALSAHIRARFFSESSIGPGSMIRSVETGNYVFQASLALDTWLVVQPELGGFAGHHASVTYQSDGAILKLTDPHNYGSHFIVPQKVVQEISRHDTPVEVEANLLKPNGPWWFVDGCLPDIPG